MRGRRIIQRGGPAPCDGTGAVPAVAETSRTVIARAAFFYAGGARPDLGFAIRRLSTGYKFFPRVLIEDPLNDAGAEPQRFADPVNTVAFGPQFQNARLDRAPYTASPQLCALGLCARETSIDALPNDTPLELGKHAEHLEHRLARGRRGVEALLMEKQIDAFVLEALEDCEQVGQRSTEPVH